MSDLDIIERFWLDVEITRGCWNWLGGKSGGYGIFRNRKKNGGGIIRAHRFSYELHYGPISEGEEVCHRCHNPSCVRPSHLYSGSHKQNMKDRDEAGRHVAHAGEKNGNAKLSDATAREIRERYERNRKLRQVELAREYGVSQATISRILLGQRKERSE